MRGFVVLPFFILFSISSKSQDTIPKATENNRDSFSINSPNTTPSILMPVEEEPAPRSFRKDDGDKAIMRNNDLGFPEYKVDQKFKEKSNNPMDDYKGEYRRNVDMGIIRTNSVYARFLVRDHQVIDGDLVKISFNDTVVVPEIFLIGDYKAIRMTLRDGFNKISFEALNEGSGPPNTVDIKLYDDQENLLLSHYLAVGTGFEGTIVILKE